MKLGNSAYLIIPEEHHNYLEDTQIRITEIILKGCNSRIKIQEAGTCHGQNNRKAKKSLHYIDTY